MKLYLSLRVQYCQWVLLTLLSCTLIDTLNVLPGLHGCQCRLFVMCSIQLVISEVVNLGLALSVRCRQGTAALQQAGMRMMSGAVQHSL